MKIEPTDIPDVLIIEPKVFTDDCGFFLESYNQRAFTDKAGMDADFVQDNHSCSKQNVLRGLHKFTQQHLDALILLRPVKNPNPTRC